MDGFVQPGGWSPTLVTEGTPSWHRFTELLHLRFGPPYRSNPLGELMACKRTGTVAEYQDRFEAILPYIGPLEEQRVQAFTAGLGPPLSHDVEMHNPQTLIVAMSMARKLELRERSSALAAAAAPPRLAARSPASCSSTDGVRGPPGPPPLHGRDGRTTPSRSLFQ